MRWPNTEIESMGKTAVKESLFGELQSHPLLVCVDMGEASIPLIRHGAELALGLGVEMIVCHVMEHHPGFGLMDEVTARIDRAIREEEAWDTLTHICVEEVLHFVRTYVQVRSEVNIAPCIVKMAEDFSASRILLGPRHHSWFWEEVFDSTARQIARLASCPVLMFEPLQPIPWQVTPISPQLNEARHPRL